MSTSLHLVGDAEADRLLSHNPFALLVGMLLDQQIPMEVAFAGPRKLAERLGVVDPAMIALMDPEEFVTVCATPPAVHRFPASMGRRVHDLATAVMKDYQGDTAGIWTCSDPDGRTMHLHSDMKNNDYPSQLHATTYSPGFALVRTTYGPGAEMIMYNSPQPIDSNQTLMRWTLIVRREIEDLAGDDVMKGIIDGLSDDYPIWANKVHKHRPVFCREDKTLVTFRKWVRQFYVTSQDKQEIA